MDASSTCFKVDLGACALEGTAVSGRECVQICLLQSLSGSQPGSYLGGQLGAYLAKGDGRRLQPPDLKWTTGRRDSPRRPELKTPE